MENIYDDVSVTTEDNTKVFRIMNDFQDFLKGQSTDKSLPRNSSLKLQNLSVNSENVESNNLSRMTMQKTLQNADLQVQMNLLKKEHLSEKQVLVKSNIKLEEDHDKLNLKVKLLEEKCDKLCLKNKQLTHQNLDLLDKVEAAEKKINCSSDLEDKVKEITSLKNERDTLMKDFSSFEMTNSELSNQNFALQCQINNLTLQLEEALSIGDLYNRKINEYALLMEKHQGTLNEFAVAQDKIHTLSSKLNEIKDIEKNVQNFKEDMNRLRFLEEEHKKMRAECERLREHQENVALLNEKLISSESKLRRTEARCEKLSQLEIANESLRRQVTNQDERLREASLNASSGEISRLEDELRALTEKNQALTSSYDQLYTKYNDERQHVNVLNTKVEEQTENCLSANAQLSRLKRRSALLSHERDTLRSILQSYDAELTMTSHTTQLNKRLKNAEEANGRLHSRIEQLEAELQKNTEELMRHRLLAKQVAASPLKTTQINLEQQSSAKSNSAEKENEIAELKTAVSDSKKENEALNEKIEELEAIIERNKMKGDYDPRHEKVVHFGTNPFEMARKKFKQSFSDLKQENTKLKKKLKEIEEGRDVSVSEIEVPQKVKNELAMAELRNKRLKEVFSKKIQEFRQACYSLTGYRIDTSGDSKFKLVSMYAESEADFLLFEMLPDGTMQLLETEFSKRLTELISLHLHHQNSIPMFLSGVSINLFGQQTMVVE